MQCWESMLAAIWLEDIVREGRRRYQHGLAEQLGL